MELNMFEYWNNYDISILSSLPERGETFHFYREMSLPRSSDVLILEVPTNLLDWLILKVKSADAVNWIGTFEPGVEGISGLYATPCESTLCVIVKGQGYWVPINTPEEYGLIPSFPIKKVVAVPKGEMMIFVDYSKLVAYGRNGFVWQTPSLSWDGLEVDNVTLTELTGLAWDAPTHQKVEFKVNLLDGSYTGGSSPTSRP